MTQKNKFITPLFAVVVVVVVATAAVYTIFRTQTAAVFIDSGTNNFFSEFIWVTDEDELNSIFSVFSTFKWNRCCYTLARRRNSAILKLAFFDYYFICFSFEMGNYVVRIVRSY